MTAVVTHAAKRGPRTSTWSLLRGRREERVATQQLQQQQPATRHRSTARRLVSLSSTRVDTPDSLPNDILVKPITVLAPSAGQRPWAHRTPGIAGDRRHRR